MSTVQQWQNAAGFADFFDSTIDRAFTLAVLTTRDRARATEATQRAYVDLWFTGRDANSPRPELRLLTLIREHGSAGAEGGTRTPTP